MVNARVSIKEYGDRVGKRTTFCTVPLRGYPSHAPLFKSYTIIGDRTFPKGKAGSSKKEAQEEAAKTAIATLKGTMYTFTF